jgi:hypothetical protein
MTVYYIAADVHCNNTELAVEHNKTIIKRFSVPTTIPAIRLVLKELGGRCHLTFEEGPMAGWLYRNLRVPSRVLPYVTLGVTSSSLAMATQKIRTADLCRQTSFLSYKIKNQNVSFSSSFGFF